jgi:thiamine pyrophosphate-dependent acetolactate synthase large subunit-like protein
LRARGRAAAFLVLADAFKGGVATTADGKGLFPEDHPQFIGEWILALLFAFDSMSSACAAAIASVQPLFFIVS